MSSESTQPVAAIILCAGKGTRMGAAARNKVCTPCAGVPVVRRILANLRAGGVSRFAALIDAAQRYVHENAWTPWGKIRFLKAADPEASVTLGLHSLYGGMRD